VDNAAGRLNPESRWNMKVRRRNPSQRGVALDRSESGALAVLDSPQAAVAAQSVPTPRPPRPPVEIPDGPPPQAALQILVSRNPDIPDELEAEVRTLNAELKALAEEARHPGGPEGRRFVNRAASAIYLRAEREATLKAPPLNRVVPDRGSPSQQIFDLVMTVARLRDMTWLREEHSRFVNQLTAARDAELAQIQVEASRVGNTAAPEPTADREARTSRLCTNFDGHKRRLEASLRRVAMFNNQLATLTDDPDRIRAASEAIQQAGGEQAIVDAIHGQMSIVDGSEARWSRQLNQIDADLARAPDPESEFHQALLIDRQEAVNSREAARAKTVGLKKAAAAGLVQRVVTGARDAIAELANKLRGQMPNPAAALDEARASQSQLIAAIELMTAD
jgi:hypothetical protein